MKCLIETAFEFETVSGRDLKILAFSMGINEGIAFGKNIIYPNRTNDRSAW